MARIPDDFDPSASPYLQLGKRRIYLDGGDIEINGRLIKTLTAQELMLVLQLLEKANTSSHGYLPAWYLARAIYPIYYDMDAPEHAIEQHISNLRGKIGESGRKPHYILGSRRKGYKLCLPDGGCSAPIPLLQKLFRLLSKP